MHYSCHCSFVIPAYNEADRIGASLEKIIAYCGEQAYSSEIIVVSDGSKDSTADVVGEFVRQSANAQTPVIFLEQPRNMGKGAAVRRGMLAARGVYRIFSDADLSTPIYETARVLEHLTEGTTNKSTTNNRPADVCIGSRGLDETLVKKHQPRYREALGKAVNKLVQSAFTPGIADTQCGFKGFTANAAEQIFSRAKLNGFIFDVEILYLAMRLGFTVEEIAVEWFNDERTTVGFRHSFNIVRELLAIKRLHRDL